MTVSGQMPIIVSDKNELRRCVMHLWKNYNGLGLNLKNSKNQGHTPHMVRDVDLDSPAHYAGVLNNDLILKIGSRIVEYEKFDTILRLIKDQLKKEKKCDMLLINLSNYYEFKKRNEDERKNVDYYSPSLLAQVKYYESPQFNPVLSEIQPTNVTNGQNGLSDSPLPRLCHLLTWTNYDGYGFFVAYNTDGCYVKTVEPNSPAQMGGLRALDKIIEINGKQVTAKDREYIMRQINKHKKSQSTLTSASKKSLKSQSGYSLKSTKSKSGVSNYLSLLTCDPTTHKWLMERRVDISTRNKNLKMQECFTPSEFSLLNLMEQSKSSSLVQREADLDAVPVTKPMRNGEVNQELANNILIKSCTIRRLKDRESEPLGFEMTKRGTQAHYLSRIEPGSSAALSGLCLNDYLIELNSKNIEQDENSVLREKIFDSLSSNGEFHLLTINKQGYDYCCENKMSVSGFCQINNQKIQQFETPHQLSTNPPDAPPPPLPSNPTQSTYSKGTPRLCTLRKTSETSELGLSIARMKNVNEHVINDVVHGSLAEKAGIKVNDCLLEVNGENVEDKSHVETVNRIIELARQPNMNINLLVAERTFVLPKVEKESSVKESSSLNKAILTDLRRAVSTEILNQPRSDEIYTSLSKANQHVLNTSSSELPSINAYPEIKVCEFLGYPNGTQLGLVVTSDEYSHDVIKVADDSPAQKAGLLQGDVIIAVNDRSVEGDPTLIEILGDFSESKPLKVLAASRYAYEWSKLLRIRMTEKDWPNIKKFSTRYNGQQAENGNRRSTHQLPDINTIYSTASCFEPDNIQNGNAQQQHQATRGSSHLSKTGVTLTNNSHSRPVTPRELGHSKIYHSKDINQMSTSSPRSVASKSYALSPRSQMTDQLSLVSNLSRSAVDITADGQVLRMCTLYLDLTSDNPADMEFGFDLVTKVGRQIGEYFIDTVDEDSPACVSGIKPGDRLVEVDGIDVKNKTFEDVVQIINEAKIRAKLKLLVHPSIIINYGNPGVTQDQHEEEVYYQKAQHQYDLNHYKSMPDLCQQQNYKTPVSRHKSPRRLTEYNDEYVKNAGANLVSNYSKSTTNIYGTTTSVESTYRMDQLLEKKDHLASTTCLKPAVRLCTLYRNDSTSNIGFGIQTKPNHSTTIPNYLRVSIVNYKSPAYLAGMEAGDMICEINGRSTLDMSHDESLYFIKSSYEINNYVKILVLSEFCFNWLREHDLLHTIRYDHASVFSYADFLKHNQRFVPRLTKVRLFGRDKTFGFNIDTYLIQPASGLTSVNKSAAYQAYAHIIIKIDKDSAAQAAGLKKGDRILELDGINVEAENDKQVGDRIFQAFANMRQLTLFVVDPETDHYFKSRCVKLHSMLPIVRHITNFSDN